jgi:hypothetical protein
VEEVAIGRMEKKVEESSREVAVAVVVGLVVDVISLVVVVARKR